MALSMIYGRSGTGKTKELFNRIRNSLTKNPSMGFKRYLIVPDQFSYQMENKVLATFGEESVMTIQVVGFQKLARQVLERVGGIRKPLLSPVGRTMVAHLVALRQKEQLRAFAKSSAYGGFAQRLIQMISELKSYHLTSQDLKEAAGKLPGGDLKGKLEDAALLFDAYDWALGEDWVDAQDQMALAIHQLKNSDYLAGAEFYLDEFSNFTPQQLALLEVLLHKGDVTMTLTLEEGIGGDHEGVFSLTRDTDEALLRLAEQGNIAVTKPTFITTGERFKDNPELAHLEAEFYHYPHRVFQGPVNSIAIHRSQNPFEEVEQVAKDILVLVREKGYRFRDMAILLGNLENYESILAGVMAQYDIPIFMDARKSIDNNPLMNLIRAFFDIQAEGFRSEAVFRYLKSGLTEIPQEELDRLENYCLAHGISGNRWLEDYWQEEVPYEKDPLLAKEELNAINDWKAEVMGQLVKGLEGLKAAKTVRGMATAFYEFLKSASVLENYQAFIQDFEGKDITLWRTYQRTLDLVMEVLDEVVDALGDESLSPEDFGSTLLVGLASAKVAVIPATLDQVIVGDISRVRAGDVKVIYIMGANDGVLPKSPKAAGLFSDPDIESLSDLGIVLSEDARTRAYYDQYFMYDALTTATDFLKLSYPSADSEGAALRPSAILNRLGKLFPDLRETVSMSYLAKQSPDRQDIASEREAFSELLGQMRRHRDGAQIDPLWRELYDYFRGHPYYASRLKRAEDGLRFSNRPVELKAEHMDELYGKKLSLTVSKLERFNECPFSYFVEYGLKAKERKEYLFERPDLGTVVHEVLDRFTQELREKKLAWEDLTPGYIESSVEAIFGRVLKAKGNHILTSGPRFAHMAYKIKRTIASAVEVIQAQILRGDFEPLYTEVAFGPGQEIPPVVLDLPEGRKVEIAGRIDRVDVLRQLDKNYIRIIDYKTGTRQLKLTDLIHGLQMQLLVYLDVILRHSHRFLAGETLPGAVFYFPVHRHIVKDGAFMPPDRLEAELIKGLKLDGFLLRDAKVIHAMDKDMAGASLIIPAQRNKGGEYSKNAGHHISQDQFEELRKYVADSIARVCQELMAGNIAISPYKLKDKVPCSYCKYQAICQFDTSLPGNDYRRLKEYKGDQAWLVISEGGPNHA